jgi:TonB-linked SusC/RagA family outer membrane protein
MTFPYFSTVFGGLMAHHTPAHGARSNPTLRRAFWTSLVVALAAFALFPGRVLLAQGTGRVTGTVTDSSSGRPISDVQITVGGTRLGTTTDNQGRFNIVNVPAGPRLIDARRIGFQPATARTVTVSEGGTVTVAFRLREAALNLQAIVTTGVVDPTSGTRVPFTVGRLDAAALPVPATNALESIQGKIAGVTVVPSGQPGSGTNIMLRSPTSINKGNAPLVVVDGVIQSTAFGASSADLESMDVESIEVVKGAAAASLYGSRASSGVIQIRTRRGSNIGEGATRFTLRSEMGSNSLAGKIDWARAHYYQTNANGQYVNAAGNVVQRAQRVADSTYRRFQDNPYSDPVYDQVDRFFDPGNFRKNSFNIAQNNARTNWFLSLVNTTEDGVVLNSGKYQQNDIRLNLDHQPLDKLKFSFSGYHSRSTRNELYGDTFFDLINQAPDVDLRAPDPDGTPYLFQPDPEGREENPLYVLATEDSKRKRARTQGSLDARFTPFGFLTVDGNVSYDRSDRRNNFFLDQGVKTEGFAQGGLGEITQTTGTTNTINAAASVNLLQAFGALTFRSTARTLLENESNEVTTANGQDFAAPGVRSLNNARTRFVSSSTEDIKASGYFFTAGADYAGRYIVDGLVRRDGSSLFGANERWNTYYRASGAWRVAQESWWMFPAVNEFKLRASQGTAGGRPSFNDQFETFAFNAAGGVLKQNLGNKNLRPEHATETEFGLDAIVNQRYSLQLSYAKSRVIDQLIQIPLAGFFGYGQQWQNAGTVEGNTLEGTLEAQIVRGRNFSWKAGLVADRSRNKITEFDRSCFTTNTVAYRCAGVSLGDMYGFEFLKDRANLPAAAQARANEFDVNDEGLLVWVGVDAAGQPKRYTQGEAPPVAGVPTGWGSSATIGATSYGWGLPITRKDSTGSSAVVRIGDGTPKYRWGLTNNVSWKGFDVFALVDAQVGGQAYNQTRQRMYQWAKHHDVDQTGKPQELKKPIEYYVGLYAANDPTEYFIEDAGFVKLRELSVRYRLGGRALSLITPFGARGAAISLIGRNLFTSTNYRGYDPEVGGVLTRLDSFDYPRYRTFTGSLEFTF